jgi:hypothetical protein
MERQTIDPRCKGHERQLERLSILEDHFYSVNKALENQLDYDFNNETSLWYGDRGSIYFATLDADSEPVEGLVQRKGDHLEISYYGKRKDRLTESCVLSELAEAFNNLSNSSYTISL